MTVSVRILLLHDEHVKQNWIFPSATLNQQTEQYYNANAYQSYATENSPNM